MADSNAGTISNFLLGKGLTRAQVAGVLGNLKIESGYSPTAYNAGEGAIGIAQWEGGRRTALQAYAAQTGGTETSLATQLGFLWHELTGTQISALNALALTTTPADAATAFDQKFERSSGAARGSRISAANTIFPAVGPGAGDAGFGSSGGGQAFRDATGALQGADHGGTNGSLPYDPTLPPGSPGGPPLTVQNPNDEQSIWGQVASGIIGPLIDFLKPAMFVIGGVALVVGGLVVAAKPAVQKAASTVQSVAQSVPKI